MTNFICLFLSFVIVASMPEANRNGTSVLYSNHGPEDEYQANCPHSRFRTKHTCSDCDTAAKAAQYMITSQVGKPGVTNDLFWCGADYSDYLKVACPFPDQARTCCESLDRMLRWVCTASTTTNWMCKQDGACRSLSALDNGHLFYNNLNCSP